MEGEEERSEKEGSFSKASIPKRIAIVLAGGFVNIIFGILIYFIIISSAGNHISNTVDNTVEGYGAEIAGIESGDQILEIQNKKIRLKSDVDNILKNSNGEDLTVKVKRDSEIQEVIIKPTEVKVKSTGIYLSASGKDRKATQIIQIEKGSSAEIQGLQVNDIVTKVNGEDVVGDQQKLIECINKENTDRIIFTIERNNEIIEIEVVPDLIPTYYLGVQFQKAENTFLNNIYYGFWNTSKFTFSIIDNLKMLFTGNVGVDQMMGPVGISSAVSETTGIKEFIYMLALISLSLGVTNLLPFPPLDGGKVVILIIEGIRRKALKQEIETGIQLVGFSILIALSIYITYNDILRIF